MANDHKVVNEGRVAILLAIYISIYIYLYLFLNLFLSICANLYILLRQMKTTKQEHLKTHRHQGHYKNQETGQDV